MRSEVTMCPRIFNRKQRWAIRKCVASLIIALKQLCPLIVHKNTRWIKDTILQAKIWSAHTEGETPVPISNTEVKPLRADGSVVVRLCESRSVLL